MWWEPADQARAAAEVVTTRSLGRGWRPMVMVNNTERMQPFGTDPASAAVEDARRRRRPTGLDEGRAWRHRDAGTLLVVRSEVYADEEPGAAERHRTAWRDHAEPALEATWRERWHERDQTPGWVEARWVDPEDGVALDDRCDWVRIEDHTDAVATVRRPGAPDTVVVYEHLTVWSGRQQVTAVVRHLVGLDLDDVVERCAAEILRHLDP